MITLLCGVGHVLSSVALGVVGVCFGSGSGHFGAGKVVTGRMGKLVVDLVLSLPIQPGA